MAIDRMAIDRTIITIIYINKAIYNIHEGVPHFHPILFSSVGV